MVRRILLFLWPFGSPMSGPMAVGELLANVLVVEVGRNPSSADAKGHLQKTGFKVRGRKSVQLWGPSGEGVQGCLRQSGEARGALGNTRKYWGVLSCHLPAPLGPPPSRIP